MQHESRQLEVLLVEDDTALAEMYRLKLERDGHVVRLAEDGPVALREVVDAPPDLMLLDIRIPGFDGFELLRRVRELDGIRDVPTVVLSNYGSDEILDRGRELGVLAHFVKSQTSPGRLAEWIAAWRGAHPEPAEAAAEAAAD